MLDHVIDTVLGLYNYWIVIILMMAGFYTVISRGNLAKKVIGLNIFQTSMFLMYISMGKVDGGTAPIVAKTPVVYTNPIPSVLILTAIVVGVATTAVGLSLAVRIRETYGTLEEDEVRRLEDEMDGIRSKDESKDGEHAVSP